MPNGHKVRVSVLSKDVFGSLLTEAYDADRVVDVISQLQEILANIPVEYRDSAIIETESEGGYEGEHHTTVEVYYYRPETAEESSARIARDEATLRHREAQERAAYEALKRKFG